MVSYLTVATYDLLKWGYKLGQLCKNNHIQKKEKEMNQFFLERTVLLVDDNQMLLNSVKTTLYSLGFSNILTANNGKDALNTYIRMNGNITLVLSDVQMPKMDGIELFWKIRRIDKGARIILWSAGGVPDISSMMNAGLKEFLEKPIGRERLEIALTQAMT